MDCLGPRLRRDDHWGFNHVVLSTASLVGTDLPGGSFYEAGSIHALVAKTRFSEGRADQIGLKKEEP